jgi:hypothetical protein
VWCEINAAQRETEAFARRGRSVARRRSLHTQSPPGTKPALDVGKRTGMVARSDSTWLFARLWMRDSSDWTSEK